VSEGYYSLHLERATNYAGLGIYSTEDGGKLPSGYYYFSWDIYFVENAGDPKMIFMYSGEYDWYVFDMSSYSTNRWYKCFFYSPIVYSPVQSCCC